MNYIKTFIIEENNESYFSVNYTYFLNTLHKVSVETKYLSVVFTELGQLVDYQLFPWVLSAFVSIFRYWHGGGCGGGSMVILYSE